MVALRTADPVDARNLARRLAARWDKVTLAMEEAFDRGILTLSEQQSLMRKALEDELADATRAKRGSLNADVASAAQRKVLIAAYRIVGAMPHDAGTVARAQMDEVIDDSWTAEERALLETTLRLFVTPNMINQTEVDGALAALGTPVNESTRAEARWMMFRGRIEAQERAALVEHPLFADSAVPGVELLDDAKVELARRVAPAPALHEVSKPDSGVASRQCPPTPEHWLFAKASAVRFSEQIDELEKRMFRVNEWQPDNGRTRQMLEAFAWLTGDKIMSDYEPSDIETYVSRLSCIRKDFAWGKLHEKGEMAVPYDPEKFPEELTDIPPGQQRSSRTVNSHISKLQAASRVLSKTYWLPKAGAGNVMMFDEARRLVVIEHAVRMPWTPEHLRTMYSLPLWQGGGGQHARVKFAGRSTVYQDAAYWAPLIATYTGMSREEICGLECLDFDFASEIPFLLVQKNMTKSKDGKTPAGLKRLSRHRVMPLHPELIELGLQAYVRNIEAEGHKMIFPELYLPDAKYGGGGEKVPAFGGRRFYAIGWRFIMDATHAKHPLPETTGGKKADFQSQRTFNMSVLAAPGVSETLIADHMGHARKGTGPRNYDRRALTLGQKRELSERLEVLVRETPVVTDHVPRQSVVSLLPLNQRSRVGSAEGRNAAERFCADSTFALE